MPFELATIAIWLPGWMLVLARVGGMVLAVPLLSSIELPIAVRALLCVAISAMVFPTVAPALPKELTLSQALAGLIGELAIGELLGLAAAVIFLGAQYAGHVVALQSGLTLGTVFNPLYDAESTVLEQIWFFIAALLFLALRGHLAVVHVVLRSMETVPPLSFELNASAAAFFSGLLESIFDLALRLAGPAMLSMLLATVALGLLTRTMPQFNMLSVGFGLKIVLAIAMMAATMSVADGPLGGVLWDSLDSVGRVLEQSATGVRTAVVQ
ncbi:MAG: flagellar biosynthetic protein FliR [Phycisphaerae bacterium]|nr:flagellar biosynthetic protein FliR [Phycisphaerae bacterium]